MAPTIEVIAWVDGHRGGAGHARVRVELFATARRKGTAKSQSDAAGTTEGPRVLIAIRRQASAYADLRIRVGAGEGNRTLMTSLEGWGSAIELRPRGGFVARCSVPGSR